MSDSLSREEMLEHLENLKMFQERIDRKLAEFIKEGNEHKIYNFTSLSCNIAKVIKRYETKLK